MKRNLLSLAAGTVERWLIPSPSPLDTSSFPVQPNTEVKNFFTISAAKISGVGWMEYMVLMALSAAAYQMLFGSQKPVIKF